MVKQVKESDGVGNGRRWQWFDGGRPLSFEKATLFLSLLKKKKKESGQRTSISMQTAVYHAQLCGRSQIGCYPQFTFSVDLCTSL